MFDELERELSIVGFTRAQELEGLFIRVDKDENRTLDFAEFLMLMYLWHEVGEYSYFFRHPTNAHVVKEAFQIMERALKVYDADGSRQFSYAELMRFVQEQLPEPVARQVVDEEYPPSERDTDISFSKFMFILYRIMSKYPGTKVSGKYKGLSEKAKDFSTGVGENSTFWKELDEAFNTLEQDFTRFDKDGNLLVDYTEITQGIPITTAGYGKLDILTRLQHAFDQVDVDQSRTLDYYEFQYLCFMMTQNGAYHDLVAESTNSRIVKKAFIDIHTFYRKYDADGNLRLTYDELERFCNAQFGMIPASLPANFDTVKYKSGATQGRDAVDVVKFMRLLYVTVKPNGRFHPKNYDPHKKEQPPKAPDVISIAKPKPSSRPKRFANVDPYKFVKTKLLGQGGQGTVHLGTYEGISVAGKTLLQASPESIEETMNEVNFFLKLDHPNCHYLLGSKTTMEKGGIMLLTEVCESGSLFDIYGKAGRKFDTATAHRIARECAVGLGFIHDIGFMHRDIKSLNVFMSKDMVAKVADFGMVTSEPTSNEPCGTPQWMAPEVLANYFDQVSYYDKRCDVFSYAILAWEIFHCKIPYGDSGLDQMGVARAVLQAGKRMALGRACPQPIQTLIVKCWDREPAKRPTFKEIVEMLDAAAPACGV